MPGILVTGANGQVGRSLQALSEQWKDWNFFFTDVQTLDITDEAAVQAFFKANSIDFCINAAGYTAVDRAESEPDLARSINAKGPQLIADHCKQHSATLIHISTDYVYHSGQNTPFEEDDPAMPQSVYARTKWEGEQAALQHCPQTIVVRTSWIYSPYGHNFLRTMLRLGKERPQLKVVYDQVGTPTAAPELADALLQIIHAIDSGVVPTEKAQGVFNYSPEGVTSWYDFALAIFEKTGTSTTVLPIRTIDYPTPAVRPPFSVMSKEKIKSVFKLKIPHWTKGLDQCIAQLSEHS